MAGMERIASTFGDIVVDADGRLVREVHLTRGRGPEQGRSDLAADLRRYVAGEPVDFAKYEVDWSGYTAFEWAVLAATRNIPYGETRTYGEIAAKIGKPEAARAVGQALGKNRTCIVVPCHRVVAVNGLGGFTGGLGWKRGLLALEGGRERKD